MVKYKNTFLILSLVITDLLVFFASFTAAIYIRILISFVYPRLPQFNPHIGTLVDKVWWMPFILIFFINYEGLYVRRLPYWEEAKELIKAIILFGILSINNFNSFIFISLEGQRFPAKGLMPILMKFCLIILDAQDS